MPQVLKDKLESQGYHILGQRGAYKACQWQKKSLLSGDVCYKQRFYGIESHRCLQMTPVVDKCTQSCEFCWRVTPTDVDVSWNQSTVSKDQVYTPKDLMDAVQIANLQSLGGYNPAVNEAVSEEKYKEARDPKHAAISLSGEPTLYPFISELIEEIDYRGMTSFLVTNGTRPEALREMALPTQLYVTLAAPDRETYNRLCRPNVQNAWELLQESQELLASLSCRRVNRLTMVKDYNMHGVRNYAAMILKGEPDFVEVKGYMFLGSSRNRMNSENAPSHIEVRAFAERLAALTGYYLVDEQPESRVVLLSHSKHNKKLQ
jgi:tRNA wybutosine-synthesizing protein 1